MEEQGGVKTTWDHVTDHPKLSATLALLVFAATFSPKVSVNAMWICLALAWLFTSLMIFGIPRLRTKKSMCSLLVLVAGISISVYGKWLAQKDEPKQESLPGISLNFLIRLENRLGGERQYLLDFGQADRSRLSVYISSEKFLTFLVIDAKGEPHSLQVALGGNDLPLDQFIYLACEIGIKSQSTIMRMAVNGRVVRYAELPFRVDVGAIDAPGGVLGADIQGQYGARFDFAELAMNASTLSEEKAAQELCWFKKGKPKDDYLKFNGKQWIRARSFGHPDFWQTNAEFAPVYTKMTEEDKQHWLDTPCPVN